MKKELKEQYDRVIPNEQKLDDIGKLMFVTFVQGFNAGKIAESAKNNDKQVEKTNSILQKPQE